MRLETPRLLIRDWRLEDADEAFKIYGDPDVMRYVGTGESHKSVDQTRERLAKVIERDRGQALGFWAAETLEGTLVGGALLNTLPDGSDVEVGYHLGKQWWGKGYATELAQALVKYGFETVGLTKIVGVTYPENIASQRVLEKAGLVHKRQSLYGEIPVEFFELGRP